MRCPKCGAETDERARDCMACGIVLAKVRSKGAQAPRPRPGGASVDEMPEAKRRLRALLFPPAPSLSRAESVARAAVLVLLLLWGGRFVLAGPRSPAIGASFAHLPHLVFHEAGHVLFMPFGRFLMVLGGPLLQFVVPLVFVVYFLRWREDAFAAAVCAYWAGHSLLDLAPYVSDARALDLVLLGGYTGKEVEGHDFEYLLTATRLLQWDVALGRVVFTLGSIAMAAALAWAASDLWRRRRSVAA